jgi:hypothetical protein
MDGISREDLIPDHALAAAGQDGRAADPAAVDDHLEYGRFVDQLARLVTEVTPPVNVALFGPWGSGKSSIGNLLKQRVAELSQGATIGFVRYDAWRYAGLSLRRSFLSDAANALGVRAERYHRRLYQDRRTGEFQLGTLARSLPSAAAVFGVMLVATIFVIAGLAGLSSVFTSEDFFGQIKSSAATILPAAGVVSLIAAVAKPFFDMSAVQIQESALAADEQFRDALDELIQDGLDQLRPTHRKRLRRRSVSGERDRVVFFVDELDRCAPEEVVEALRALKTFLEVPNSVFVLAADRDVLETALEKLPQATPVNEELPYFSSAGSFLDKVFQYQLQLPPLRGRKLTRFARDLVLNRSDGLWRELADPKYGQLVEEIVYTLIPAHVRSPRRAKILLNKFAANARMAAAHGIPWIERAEEIAKLTVLQTEFPALAEDLQLEPRLPELLLRPPRHLSTLQASLLARHDVGASSPDGRIGARALPTDRPLSGTAGGVLIRTQRGDLRRYLERTATVPDPRRDLLFLEGVDDAELLDRVETFAPESPGEIAKCIEGLDDDVKRRMVAEVLLDLLETAEGQAKRNIVIGLLQTVQTLGDEARPLADRVSNIVRSYRRGNELPGYLLAPALRISEQQQARFPVPLTSELLDESELWSDPDRVREVMKVSDTLTAEQMEAIGWRLAASYLRWPDTLTEALEKLPREAVPLLFDNAELSAAITQRLETARRYEGDELATRLLESGTREEAGVQVSLTAIPLLAHVDAEAVYRAVRKGASERDPYPPGDPNARCVQSLLALRSAPPRDWEFWANDRLIALTAPTPEQSRWALEAILAVMRRFPRTTVKRQQVATEIVARAAASAAAATDAEQEQALLALLDSMLTSRGWDTVNDLGHRRNAHAFARNLALSVEDESDDAGLAPAIWERLADDLRAAPLRSPEAHDLAAELAAALPVTVELEALAEPAPSQAWQVSFDRFLKALHDVGADSGAVRALADRFSPKRARNIVSLEPFMVLPGSSDEPPSLEDLADFLTGIATFPNLDQTGQAFVARSLEALATADDTRLWQAMDEITLPARVAKTLGATTSRRLGPTVTASTGLVVVPPESVDVARLVADVVIIGSGAAGSVLADRLARAGRRVLVLERGPLVDPVDEPDRELRARKALDEVRRGAAVDVQQGRCVGGTTFVTHGVAVPLPPAVRESWRTWPVDLGALEAATHRFMGGLASLQRVDAGRLLQRARRLLFHERDDDPSVLALSALHTTLPRAQLQFGAGAIQILTGCRVERLETKDERVTALRCRLGDRRLLQIHAQTVICAAGAIQSSDLLQRSRISRRAGEDIRFNLTALVLAEYRDEKGLEPDEGRYFVLDDAGFACESRPAGRHAGALGMPGWFEDVVLGRRREGASWTVAALTVASSTGARLIPARNAREASVLEYEPAQSDVQRIIEAIGLLAEDLLDEGARVVKPATRREIEIRPDDRASLSRQLQTRAQDLVLTSGQPLGGNPIGESERDSVLDTFFRPHGMKNLFVCDASVLPTATVVYPQLTIMALADVAAERMLHADA